MPMPMPAPAVEPAPADVLLRDGTIAVIRPLAPADLPGLLELHEGVSDDSLRLRFFSPSRYAATKYVEHLRDAPDTRSLVLERDGRICALATAEPVEPGAAEVAFLVADDLQGLGVGSLLLEHLAAACRECGVRRFVAEVLWENRAMLAVFIDAGFAVVRHNDGATVAVEMDTVASAEAVAAADHRECQAEARSLRPLLYPRSVAVVGARADGSGLGAAIVRSVVAGGYTGGLHVVHSRAREIEGILAVRRLSDLPAPVDLVVIAVPPGRVLAVLEDAADAAIPAAVIVTSGFSEMGEEGARLQRRILALARRRSIRVVGPNCLGLMSLDPEVRLNATLGGSVPPPGGLAVASQSGGVGVVLADTAQELGVGVASFVSLGDKVDVSSNDLLAAWRDDPRVTAAALYLDSFGNAPKFARFARRFAERKPLLAVVGGRSSGGRRAGASHTAAPASSAIAVDALFAQAGVIGCEGADDMAETALLLAEQPLPRGRRIAVLTNAGGTGVLAADAADAWGLAVPELSDRLRARVARHLTGTAGVGNPVDTGATVSARDLAAVAGLLLASDEVDAVLVLLVATGANDAVAGLHAVAAVRARHPDKPLVLVPMGGLRPPAGGLPGVTTYRNHTAALRALSRAARYAEWRDHPATDAVAVDRDRAEDARVAAAALMGAATDEHGWLSVADATGLLAAYGLDPLGEVVTGAEAAVEVAGWFGYPVAVKVAGRAVPRKSERGLVKVGLSSPEEVAAAIAGFERELGETAVPVLVQSVASGVEIALGVVRDTRFGPLVMVAAGGVAVEVWQDRTFLLPPVARSDALRAVRSLRIWPLLEGYRGSPPADVDGLVDLLVELGALAEDVPQIADVDLNPVLVGPESCAVVDVKVRLDRCAIPDPGIPRRLRPGS
ncbi:GNAT family N-acetyltransferase [Nocardioides sp.]|uniref:bifunctional acetate--CoA ligase family protein/GNAT family N-acetyltransferase n=1 Tax=Nocardioides sp. TaxID=35761 RepID=UPI002636536F|nr:GNAT family N-acetyltransferase [Nocardioides sp.]MDI6912147.1 GNAT family N-acetyltransferase [Nocardioides sp.]